MRSLLNRIKAARRTTARAISAIWAHLDSEWAFACDVRSREPIDDETFWAANYKKSGIPFEVATTVRRIYGEQLGHDYRKLRASDFDPAMLEIDTVEMVLEIEEALGVGVSDDEAGETRGSIDGIVQLFARNLDAFGPKPIDSEPTSVQAASPVRRTPSSA